MRDSWYHFLHRMALACVVSVASMWSSAMCYAQLAADNASDPVYVDGWQGTTTNNITGVQQTTGDNGGFGFEPWNFDTDWLFNPDPIDGIQDIDSSSPFNQIGTAWRMAMPEPVNGVGGLPRAGRGFAPLQVGQTVRVIFDNPAEQLFFKGYFVRLNSRNGESGGGNLCYDFPGYTTACSAADLNGNGNYVPLGATPEPKLNVRIFEYFSFGQWGIEDGNGFENIPLFDTDDKTAIPPQVGTDEGVRLEVTLTGTDSYDLTMTPLDNPAAAYMRSGILATPGEPIDWIEFTMFNTITNPDSPTDLYIRSIEILGTVTGDFNHDGNYDCVDINALVEAIAAGSNPPPFDLTGDGSVNLADRDAWLTEAGVHNLGPGRAYLLGDASLDGVVDGSDFGLWNGNKFTNVAAWCSGDFNADGAVDGSDFGIWNANKFTSSDSVGVVPEPAIWVGVPFAVGYLLDRKRRSKDCQMN